jgi:hypothetical protein
MIPKFKAYQKNGLLYVDNPQTFKEYLLSLGDKVLDVVVKVHRKDRSDNQNRYLHGCILPTLCNHTGYSADEMKDIVKTMFLRRFVIINGKEIEVVRGTAKLTTLEAETFFEQIRRWAALELGLSIPTPNEVDI